MPVVVKEAPRIGMSNKMIVETVFYVNCRKCLTDTMIVCVRMGMIAARRVAAKRKHVLTARLVVPLNKSVRTKCLPFVAPRTKPVSIIVVVIPLMQMQQNVVPTASELTAPVAQPTRQQNVVPTASELTAPVAQPTRQPVPTAQRLTKMGVPCVRRKRAPLTNRSPVPLVPIPGVAQKVTLAEQTKENVFWRQFFVIMTVHVLKVMR